jgi:cytoskeletal protein CcmA (bactofilin family)
MAWMRQDPKPDQDLSGWTPDPPIDVIKERKTAAPRPAGLIGKSVLIKGEVCGEEDLVIEGRVEGKVLLNKSRLTIGGSGRIDAEVRARWIVVSGEVNGDITAGDRLEITAGGRTKGNLRAPRIVVAEGASMNGKIDTDPIGPGKPDAPRKEASPAPRTDGAVEPAPSPKPPAAPARG